jgi:hypothetical protein
MEHIGKHLEKAAGGGSAGNKIVVQQGSDQLLVHWALQQGIIEPNGVAGGFRLVIAGNGKTASTPADVDADDEDAEGEVDE